MYLMLVVVLAGAGGSLSAWLIARPAMGSRDMTFQPDMPWHWRLCWPWISSLSGLCEPMLSWRQRDRLTRLAKQASLPTAITPAHMLAWVINWMVLGAIAGAGLTAYFGMFDGLFWSTLGMGVSTGFWPIAVLRARVRRRRRQIARELPFVLDLMTLCVESGLSLHGALQQAEQHGPSGPLRQQLTHALSDMRAGVPRVTALTALAERSECPSVRSWVAAMLQADGLGMSVGVLLREHAAQCRSDRFQHAEKLALEAPVKMLLPLIGCIFPCTFIVLAFPIVVQMWEAMR
ncbi:type II secretion system F family protein [Bordetella tumulicola]|uniref:type II secretion system F family protein n=1 Tax=Bordetella tumulicola TaxID=1649133 RepID=UPI0039EEEC30